MEQAGGAQCDVAAADQQYPNHVLATRVLRADARRRTLRFMSSP
jgi:L-fucose mutarotase/ribose pyranase (RbsD/FucU family)